MTILSVAAEVAAFLEELDVPYAIIGGLAAQHWGEPRFTRDVDVAVLAPSAQQAAPLVTTHDVLGLFEQAVRRVRSAGRRRRAEADTL